MYGFIDGVRDPFVVDCALPHCHKPVTQFDIYCEGHGHITESRIQRMFFSETEWSI